jgi:uncharacterized membrane protein
MSLAPFWQADALIKIHALAAVSAFFLGAVQLSSIKGNQRHRMMGYVWIALMYIAAVSSLFIHHNPMFGPFSLIHLLSLLVIFGTPSSVLAARRGNVRAHKFGMIQLYVFGLIVAGTFAALAPGRMFYRILFE